jgi:hypothetical protein
MPLSRERVREGRSSFPLSMQKPRSAKVHSETKRFAGVDFGLGCLQAGSLCFMFCRRTLLVMPLIAFGAGVVAPAADDFVLARNRVGNVIIGMPESAIYRVYPRQITRKVDLQLEGMPTPAVQVFLTKDRRHPSLVIRLDGPVSGVYGVEVMDSRFKTARGIGVGSSFWPTSEDGKGAFICKRRGDYWRIGRRPQHDFQPGDR